MIEKIGYLKLIDFGTSRVITDFIHTIILIHYIAPEILIGKGYSLTTGYWSIGICMNEIFLWCISIWKLCNGYNGSLQRYNS